jgi:hypothetical protein
MKAWAEMKMTLVTGLLSVFKEIGTSVAESASSFYVVIPSDFLSEPYELLNGDAVTGEILKLVESGFEHTEFKEKVITFVLRRSVGFDNLFISKKDWQTNFRDRGLVRANYQLSLRLTEAIKADGKIIKLYPELEKKLEETLP